MTKVSIGQIGVCHEHAGAKMNALRLRPDVFEVVGVVDDRSSKAARFAGDDLRPYEGLAWMSEEELFAFPGLQAVMVETPNHDLVPTAIRCMERGLAIHMDKPGGEDMPLFDRLLDGCNARHLPFQMGYMFRNNPAMQWTINAVRQGWLGEVFEIQASMSHDYGGDAYQHYLGQFPGGIMFNLGCHLIDLIVATMGRPQQVLSFLKSAPGFPDTIKNNCLAILEYPYATATLRASSLEVGGLDRRRFKLCGTNGSVDLCPMERFDGEPLLMSLILKEAIPGYSAGSHTVDFGVTRDRYEYQLLEFAKIVSGELSNPYTYEHDSLVQEVVLAAAGKVTWKA
ncbi:MAG TPA: Gfo/Idh/MocA family oxidoreductase [Capsulimonadaceae bacterium]|jgi:predicted dehydrogenase